MKTEHRGIYGQIERLGQDRQIIARIRDRYTVYAWAAFFSEADARRWIDSQKHLYACLADAIR